MALADYLTVTVPDMGGIEMQYYFNSDTSPTPQKTFPPHIHDCLEVYLLLEGDVSFLVEGRLYRLMPGDAVLSRPNELHNCILNSDSVHRHYCFWFRSDPGFLFGDFYQRSPGAGNLLSPATAELRKSVLDTADALYRASENGGGRLREYAEMVRLVSLWHDCLDTDTVESELPEQLREILRDMEENLPAIHDLSYFSEKYYLSAAQLRRLFRQHLQTTPKSYLESKRLACARTLMRRGMGVTEACMEAGFSDLSNFIRLFRMRFGITPLSYRRAQGGEGDRVKNQYKAP